MRVFWRMQLYAYSLIMLASGACNSSSLDKAKDELKKSKKPHIPVTEVGPNDQKYKSPNGPTYKLPKLQDIGKRPRVVGQKIGGMLQTMCFWNLFCLQLKFKLHIKSFNFYTLRINITPCQCDIIKFNIFSSKYLLTNFSSISWLICCTLILLYYATVIHNIGIGIGWCRFLGSGRSLACNTTVPIGKAIKY